MSRYDLCGSTTFKAHGHESPPPKIATLFGTNTLKRTFRAGTKKAKKSDIAKVVRNSRLIRTHVSGPLAEVGEEAATLLAMIMDVSKGLCREVPRTTVLTGAFALLYALNPFDLMPDFVPSIGYLDDISIFMMVMNSIGNGLDSYRAWTREHSPMALRIKSTVAGIKKPAHRTSPSRSCAREIKPRTL